MKKDYIKVLKYILSIILIGVFVYFLYNLNRFKTFSSMDLKTYLLNYGNMAPILYIIMFTLVPLTLFPDSILAIGGGLAFGLIRGSIYTLIGAMMGASLSFYLARFLGRDFIRKITKHKLAHFEDSLEKNGFMLILILRMIPLFPFDVISYSAGISKIKFKDFILASLIGIIPGILVYTNLGDKSETIGSKSFYASICFLILLFAMSFILKDKLFSKKLKEVTKE